MSISRTWASRGAALTLALGMVITPTAAAAADSNEHVDISVTIPTVDAGLFTWTVPSSVSLGTATQQGTFLEAVSSELIVQVTDTRIGAPAWSISGRATQFERTEVGAVFSSAYLGWRPELTQSGAGAIAGPEAPSGYDPANPLTPIASNCSCARAKRATTPFNS